MRKSTKCPWCKSEMKEMEVDKCFSKYYRLYCRICESEGPVYFKKGEKKIYLPSKNGV